jgi:hypothetical protein
MNFVFILVLLKASRIYTNLTTQAWNCFHYNKPSISRFCVHLISSFMVNRGPQFNAPSLWFCGASNSQRDWRTSYWNIAVCHQSCLFSQALCFVNIESSRLYFVENPHADTNFPWIFVIPQQVGVFLMKQIRPVYNFNTFYYGAKN